MSYTQMVFINLPVTSLTDSIKFYTSLGFIQNQKFSNDDAAMVSHPMEETQTDEQTHPSPINVMLLTQKYFTTFLPEDRKVIDPSSSVQVLNCLSARSREAVDGIVKKAGEAGGKIDVRAKQDQGWMYGRAFADPDGHLWELVWMSPEGYEAHN